MADWQSNKTAPKDGTGFLAIWVFENTELPVSSSSYSIVRFDLDRDSFIFDEDNEYCSNFTHWQPLPEPPNVHS